MNRKVLIIGSRLSEGKRTFYNGVTNDVNRYIPLFTSATGGAYYNEEAFYCFNPTVAILKDFFAKNPTDFTTIVFSGHGYIDRTNNRDMLWLNEKQIISLIQLIKMCQSPKKLIILDKCSKITPSYFNLTGFGDVLTENFDGHIDFDKARRIFNNAILKSKPGVQVISSCSPNQLSYLDASGSHFSKSLVTSISKWADKIEPYSVLLGTGALNLSKKEMRVYRNNQLPIQLRSDEEVNFPIGIRLGTELIQSYLY
ncbi:MAG: caspase family protein [Bacteroidota bacterium]|nr:caspase family protein [Bacteroidota bacterium]